MNGSALVALSSGVFQDDPDDAPPLGFTLAPSPSTELPLHNIRASINILRGICSLLPPPQGVDNSKQAVAHDGDGSLSS
uniref:Uncharacterized protein n=1 Tax=Knipowitschia caucasica TaxID=637954 RepID=A0AAV2KZ29_KNICA